MVQSVSHSMLRGSAVRSNPFQGLPVPSSG
jgi:hypothetical protein